MCAGLIQGRGKDEKSIILPDLWLTGELVSFLGRRLPIRERSAYFSRLQRDSGDDVKQSGNVLKPWPRK